MLCTKCWLSAMSAVKSHLSDSAYSMSALGEERVDVALRMYALAHLLTCARQVVAICVKHVGVGVSGACACLERAAYLLPTILRRAACSRSDACGSTSRRGSRPISSECPCARTCTMPQDLCGGRFACCDTPPARYGNPRSRPSGCGPRRIGCLPHCPRRRRPAV